MKQFVGSIVEVEHDGEHTLRIVCRNCNDLDSSLPGQFVMFRPTSWKADPLLGRPLSILAAGNGRAEFLVRMAGKGTLMLESLKTDDEVLILGPIGRAFPEPEPGVHTILAAGGVGLPPLLMWAERALNTPGICTTLIYGAQTKKDLLSVDRIKRLENTDQNNCFKVVWTTDDGSHGRKGLVTDSLQDVLNDCADGDCRVFACGPNAMMKGIAEICSAKKIPCWVSLENRMACGRGVCLGCALEDPDGNFFLVCEHGPVKKAEMVKWA